MRGFQKRRIVASLYLCDPVGPYASLFSDTLGKIVCTVGLHQEPRMQKSTQKCATEQPRNPKVEKCATEQPMGPFLGCPHNRSPTIWDLHLI